jgi:phenylalanine-4-hydroxylase
MCLSSVGGKCLESHVARRVQAACLLADPIIRFPFPQSIPQHFFFNLKHFFSMSQFQLLEFLKRRYEQKHRVSVERVVSGPGIANV